MLNDSSEYWKSTFNNIGMCNCDRDNLEEQKDEVTNLDKNNTEQVTKSNESKFEINIVTTNYMEVEYITDVSHSTRGKKKENDTLSLNSCAEDSNRYSNSKRNWTPEEDSTLLSFVSDTNSRNWKKISHILGNKTAPQCAYRYNKLISEMTKAKWNRNDDILLLELTELYGQNWNYIVTKMPGRTVDDIMQRYIMKLDPKLKRSRFDKDEDELILKLHEKYGNKWNEISKYFPNRNASMVKNRYYSYLKKKNNEGSHFTTETLSDYSFPISPPTNGRNTVSYNDKTMFKENFIKQNYVLNDCDIDMLNDDLNNNLYLNNIDMNLNIDNIVNNVCKNDGNLQEYRDNQVPKQLITVDENSPKLKFKESDEKFDQEYNKLFDVSIKKRESFEDNVYDDQFYLNNKISNENENLLKQYHLLESVFKKIYEVSSFKSEYYYSIFI